MFRKLGTAAVLLTLLAVPAQAFNTEELLSLVAMPLAVAAVADLTGVPLDQLASLAGTLNNASVPPVQFVEVMRYIPVALVDPNGAQFVSFVRNQAAQGTMGMALITTINQQLPTYGVPQSEITVLALRPERWPSPSGPNWFPPIVYQTFARAGHPHSGPPGQLKKERGLQTGAEVVHGSKPGRQNNVAPQKPGKAVKPPMVKQHEGRMDPGQGMGSGQGKGHGQGRGKGKGKD